jgi:UDP-N-acetyl-D-galactosamine dehydrogenase
MPIFVAQKAIKLLVENKKLRVGARVGVLGLSFKENVRDLRNSRVPEIVRELESFGLEVLVHDPVADPAHALHEYGITLRAKADLRDCDAVIFAVSHQDFLDDTDSLFAMIKKDGWIIDVKSVLDPRKVPAHIRYWSL